VRSVFRRLLMSGGLVAALGVVLSAGNPPPPRSFHVTKVGHGRPMILIPGLLSSGEVWQATVERFQTRYECHVLTLAGFAGRPPVALTGRPFLETVGRDLARYIEAEHIDRPIVVGHSLGGFVAFAVAAAHPDAVGPIVAVDGVPFLPALMDPNADPQRAAAQAAQLRDFYATLTPAQLVVQSKMALASMLKAPSDVERAAAWSATSDPKTAGLAVHEMMTTDLRPVVAAIRTPVLLIGAAEFAKDAEARARVLDAYEQQVAAVPNHRVVLAEEARHFVMWDAPDFLWRTMDAFLATSDVGPTAATPGKGR
jgi:N-formylmaleamate deformylase